MIKAQTELSIPETLNAWDALIADLKDKLAYCEKDFSIQLATYSNGVVLWDVFFTDEFCSNHQLQDLAGDRDDLNGLSIFEGKLRARFLSRFE